MKIFLPVGIAVGGQPSRLVIYHFKYFNCPCVFFYTSYTLLCYKKTKHNLPFLRIFWLFLFFILACGFTHLFDAIMFWYPVYRASAFVLFVTALVSWLAVLGLYRVIPSALALKSPLMLEKIIDERTEQLKEANEYLTKTNLELHESKITTEKLIKQKDDFLNVASHELKTPVTSLKAYTQLLFLQANEKNDPMKDTYAKMDAQINKLTVLINDLLNITKVQEGILVYKKEKFNLSKTLGEVTDEMQRTTLSHDIILKENAAINVLGDQERIAQVITNLLSNAIKYSTDNNQVIVRIVKENNRALCSVQDFGIGIPEEQQNKVFEKFYRVTGDNLHTYPGMGLGLHIVKEIVTKHNGKVWLRSEEGKGSTFYFSLPVVD